jgi:tol-pal system protein YbgF
MEYRLEEIEGRLGIEPQPMVPQHPDPPEQPAETDEPDDGGGANGTAADAGEGADEAGAAPTDDGDAELVDRARGQLDDGDTKAAMKTLRAYLDAHPDGTRTAEAWVLLGDAYFTLGKYKESISSYETFVQSYPEHERVPQAMLQQGLAFIELGSASDLDAARVFLDDLVDRYPDSPEAERARKKIQILE